MSNLLTTRCQHTSIKLSILRLFPVAGSDWWYSCLKRSTGAFSGTWVHIFESTEIVSICPNWRGRSCRPGAGWEITLVGDRVIPRTGVEGCPTLLLAEVSPQAWVDSQGEAKRRGEWDGEAIQSAPISLSLSIPFVTCHGLAPTHPLSCPEHVIHPDVSILADKPSCSICFSTLRQITWESLTDGWFP